MTSDPASLRAIYRYPVKGLSPQPMERTRLAVGQTIPADRLYAIENGPCGFDPAAPTQRTGNPLWASAPVAIILME